MIYIRVTLHLSMRNKLLAFSLSALDIWVAEVVET